jgi:hypothetical protein
VVTAVRPSVRAPRQQVSPHGPQSAAVAAVSMGGGAAVRGQEDAGGDTRRTVESIAADYMAPALLEIELMR